MKNIPIYDFARDMPMNKKYWTEGIHNNEAGTRKKAQLFAKFIVENKLLEKQKNPEESL